MKRILSVVLFSISVSSLSASDGYTRDPLIDVLNYTFQIEISDSSNIIFGKTTISLSFTGDVSAMKFDLKNLRPDGKGMAVDSVVFSGCRIEWLHKEDEILVTPAKVLSKGSGGILRIVYHGIPADGLIISENKYKNRSFFSDNWPNRASNYIP